MQIKVIKSKNFDRIIRQCYSSDPELCEKYHLLAPMDVETCIRDTVAKFAIAEQGTSFIMYELWDEERLCGYFGKENYHSQDIMTGFFVMPEYRNKEFIKRFWKIVKSKMPAFHTMIYQKNTRASLFLKKSGLKQLQLIQDKEGMIAEHWTYGMK